MCTWIIWFSARTLNFRCVLMLIDVFYPPHNLKRVSFNGTIFHFFYKILLCVAFAFFLTCFVKQTLHEQEFWGRAFLTFVTFWINCCAHRISIKKCNFCLRLCFIQYVRQSNVSKYQESTEFRNRRKIIIHALTRILYKTLPLIIENIYTRQVSLKKALAFPVKIFLVENIVWTLNKTNVMNKTVIMTKVESMLFIYSFYLFTC